jgi:hypothetical protein
MPRIRALLILVLLSACQQATPLKPAEQPKPQEPVVVDPGPGPCTSAACTPFDPVLPYEGAHPLDRAIHETLARAGGVFRPAGELELCKRLMADLTGKLPSRAEFEARCSGKSTEQIIDELRATDRYLLTAERWWRDRLNTNDVVTDWRYVKELYEMVDQLHLGTLRYDEFAIDVLSHPGFVMQEFFPEDMARRAFLGFLGRPATEAEALDLSGLYRAWIPAQGTDRDFPEIYTFLTYIAPEFCTGFSRCKTELFGGAEMTIPASLFIQFIPWENLNVFQRDALRVPGRLFVEQPIFWEAAADAILDRFLGWSDGGRFPRRPGIVLPELRQALAEYLRETGDYLGAEKLLLTSRLYLQTAVVEPDGFGDDPNAPEQPVYAHGPVKAANAETWIDSVAPLTFGDLGNCDPRYPNFYAMALLYDAFDRGAISSTAALGRDLLLLYEMQEGKYGMYPGAYGFLEPSGYYQYYAAQLGGCPGFGTMRGEASGLAFGFAQETFAELACTYAEQAAPPNIQEPSLEELLEYQMNMLYARSPRPEELAVFESARNNCSADDCTSNGVVRSTCTALLGSAEMLFY